MVGGASLKEQIMGKMVLMLSGRVVGLDRTVMEM